MDNLLAGQCGKVQRHVACPHWLVWCYSLRGWFHSGLRLLSLLDGFEGLVLANLFPGRTRSSKRYPGHYTCLGSFYEI